MRVQSDLQTERARILRQASLPSEKKLWQAFRALRPEGVHIRRQHPIGGFYLDFYCAKAKLALEVDGTSHEHRDRSDAARDIGLLQDHRIKVERVTANSITTNAEEIARWFISQCRARLNR